MNKLAESLRGREPITVLAEHGIKTSHQRVVILRYLIEHDTHPSAETLYRELARTTPGLSKTTVYNTVKLFASRGLIEELSFDSKEQRYDLRDPSHGHFRCRSCGRIFDIPIRRRHALWAGIPEGFKAEVTHHYVTGLCSECA